MGIIGCGIKLPFSIQLVPHTDTRKENDTKTIDYIILFWYFVNTPLFHNNVIYQRFVDPTFPVLIRFFSLFLFFCILTVALYLTSAKNFMYFFLSTIYIKKETMQFFGFGKLCNLTHFWM